MLQICHYNVTVDDIIVTYLQHMKQDGLLLLRGAACFALCGVIGMGFAII